MRIDSTSNLRIRKSSRARLGFTYRCRQMVAYFTAFGILVFLTGCASSGKTQSTNVTQNSASLFRADMVIDLVSVLPQILEPLNTTIQISDTESGDAVVAMPRLVELGYGIQRVNADQGSRFLYVTELLGANVPSQGEVRLRLSIGDLELTRSYQIIQENANIDASVNLVWRNNRAVIPAGPLKVGGTRQSLNFTGIGVELANSNSDLENGQNLELTEGTVAYAALAPIDGGIPTITLITEDLVKRVTVAASAGPSLQSLNLNSQGFENVIGGDVSAFTAILDDYNRIIREFVVFPNDSRSLGRPGKLVVKKLVGRFSATSDIIGLTGCSNGSTTLAIGNEGLALGRAERIAEELVAAGISRERVFDQGCWSPTADAPGFPNRGVVIDLWRRAG